jgi:hypothetical protein
MTFYMYVCPISYRHGDVFSLCVDGITQTTNEVLDDFPAGLTERTGSDYHAEVRHEIRSIRTGEARTAKSHPNLPCRHVILTVGPKYSDKYKTAAETALYSCYNGVLQVRHRLVWIGKRMISLYNSFFKGITYSLKYQI